MYRFFLFATSDRKYFRFYGRDGVVHTETVSVDVEVFNEANVSGVERFICKTAKICTILKLSGTILRF